MLYTLGKPLEISKTTNQKSEVKYHIVAMESILPLSTVLGGGDG
jgi:hypothetical protein